MSEFSSGANDLLFISNGVNIKEIKEILAPILRKNSVKYAGVFGSAARGEDRPDSDLDILVKFSGPATFAGYLKLDEDLRRTLGREVDLVTEGGINKFLRPEIEKDLKIIYGQK